MTGGSDDARTPKDGRRSVDAAWDELIGESDEDHGDTSRRDDRPVTAGHAAARRPDADDEMARLMGGQAPKLPALDPDTVELGRDAPGEDEARAPKVGTRDEPIVSKEAGTPSTGAARPEIAAKPSFAPPKTTARDEPVAASKTTAQEPATASKTTAQEPATTPKTTARDEPASSTKTTAPSKSSAQQEPSDAPTKSSVAREDPAAKARASRPSLRVVEVPPPPRHQGDERGARASRPAEPEPAVVEPEPKRGLPWAWIGLGAIGLGVVAYVATREPASSSSKARDPAAPVAGRTPQAPVKAEADSSAPTPAETTAGDAGSDDVADSGDSGGAKPPTPRSNDPREPPPGTPPEIAAVFRRLPVGPADRPPVGGIGATGIHIDHIAMGSETQGATCRGRSGDFSVSAGDRAAVCVRVVHSREKEELQLLWQKHGGSTRRSKMVVLPMHAYRTRGYLVLRSEYIGDWTVRILSSDGVELARHDFTVVP